MPLIIDEKQLLRLEASKRRRRRGRSVKPSAKQRRKLEKRTTDLWNRVLKPTEAKVKQMVRDKASASEIAQVLQFALDRAEFEYGVHTDDIVNSWMENVDTESRVAFRKGLVGSMGVDISAMVDIPEIAETLSLGSMEAAGLIKSIPGEYLGQIAKAVTDNFAGISLPDNRSLLQQIMEVSKSSKKRAQLIARDQTSKLTSAVNKTRQSSIGVSMYIWHNMKDERVVGNPGGLYPKGNKAHGNHWIMEGVHCRWDDNTVYSADKGKTWKKRKSEMPESIPGWEIQCRCFAEPVIDLDEILKYSQVA